MKKSKKSMLDEMQEQKLLKIEHIGCWLAFWGLLIVMFIQILVDGENIVRNNIGEWAVFMCLAVYLLVACVKNGIWDRSLKADFKTNFVASLIAGLAVGIFNSVNSFIKYESIGGSIATGIILFAETFILCLGALTIVTKIYKKRVKKLEGDEEEEE